MTTEKTPKEVRREKTGPKPDRVIIEGDWESAVDKALQKKRPAEGWPKDKDN